MALIRKYSYLVALSKPAWGKIDAAWNKSWDPWSPEMPWIESPIDFLGF
jgi:hypothetical protein